MPPAENESSGERARGRTAPAQPSASVLLLRDGTAGVEVFMLQRPDTASFATGALVFPGGKVEPEDSEPALAARCRGLIDGDPEGHALRIAAIRETYEESGVFLARPRGGERLLGADRLAAIEARYGAARAAHRLPLAELVEEEDLELACDLLVRFAHWVTPTIMPRRFDTHFFAAPVPEGQHAVHDGGESIGSLWLAATDAAEAAKRGEHRIMFPTLMNLGKVGRSDSVGAALERARRDPVVRVLPEVIESGGRRRLRIPEEAGYGVTEVAAPTPPAPRARR